MFNTLMYAKKLEEAGFSRQQAEANVQIMAEIIGDGMVTKEDLRQFGTQLEYRLIIKLGTLLVIGFTDHGHSYEVLDHSLKMWIDVHTHLEMLEENTEQVLLEAKALNVTNMITIGCHPNDFERVCTIAEKNYPTIAATLGVHPHEAKFYSPEVENTIRSKASKPFIIGIGEIGLDYFYNHSDPEIQRGAFNKQMELACDLNLPVEIHSRDAEDDTISELQRWKGKVTGMMHCFSGTEKLARAALDVGFYISLSGVITFKNAQNLRDVIKNIPIEKLLIETDAPFLAPVPMRGRKNKPAFVSYTAEKVAEIKGLGLDELSHQLAENTKTLFPKWDI